MAGCLVRVSGAQLALSEVQQHRWMRLQRIRLQECQPCFFVLMLIVELNSFAKALPSHLHRCVVLSARRAGCDEADKEADGADEPGGVAKDHSGASCLRRAHTSCAGARASHCPEGGERPAQRGRSARSEDAAVAPAPAPVARRGDGRPSSERSLQASSEARGWVLPAPVRPTAG